ncbi:hypothetical protein M231_02634 [Tremella mesenterica]|uniref:Uncharacterized protein n=1 Tax=Tremella mesenterica TaxID=5217 RepID=A0A4Q1BQG9_TREME|nr:uncharacterized protein TREMEDRAFT_61224 [Tremella mesenterica DSM 1558]EIW70712.1 hypothetical protein TREMEDRAFT_61224 [Tremella mesenterica DSM 1558]RXK40176.1 hypothetical protein M231_02634 [Tremella mesenterica]
MYIPLPLSILAVRFASSRPNSSPALIISTPDTLTQCQPATFSWSPTTSPYYLALLTSSDHSSSSILELDAQAYVPVPRETATWVVDVEEGTTVTVLVRDATGEVAFSEMRLVEHGNGDCLL